MDKIDFGSSRVNESLLILTCLRPLADLLIHGVGAWTTESRRRYLCALDVFLNLVGTAVAPLLPAMLACLGTPLRDEETDVRISAEKCCTRLGLFVSPESTIELVLPRLLGTAAGTDTATQRAMSARLLTFLLKGFAANNFSSGTSAVVEDIHSPFDFLSPVSVAVADPALYAHREPYLREAVLILVRCIIDMYTEQLSASTMLAEKIVISLTFLQCRCPGESDVVADVAVNEAKVFLTIPSTIKVLPLVTITTDPHFLFLTQQANFK